MTNALITFAAYAVLSLLLGLAWSTATHPSAWVVAGSTGFLLGVGAAARAYLQE